MTTRMPAPRIVAYAASTGRALVDCGEHVAWMTAEDAGQLLIAWRDIAREIVTRNIDVDAPPPTPPPTVVFEPEALYDRDR